MAFRGRGPHFERTRPTPQRRSFFDEATENEEFEKLTQIQKSISDHKIEAEKFKDAELSVEALKLIDQGFNWFKDKVKTLEILETENDIIETLDANTGQMFIEEKDDIQHEFKPIDDDEIGINTIVDNHLEIAPVLMARDPTIGEILLTLPTVKKIMFKVQNIKRDMIEKKQLFITELLKRSDCNIQTKRPILLYINDRDHGLFEYLAKQPHFIDYRALGIKKRFDMTKHDVFEIAEKIKLFWNDIYDKGKTQAKVILVDFRNGIFDRLNDGSLDLFIIRSLGIAKFKDKYQRITEERCPRIDYLTDNMDRIILDGGNIVNRIILKLFEHDLIDIKLEVRVKKRKTPSSEQQRRNEGSKAASFVKNKGLKRYWIRGNKWKKKIKC